MSIAELFRDHLGVLTTEQLLAAGVQRAAIERAIARGSLERLRRGWIAWQPDPRARTAVLHGGCVSCMSALALGGAWLPRGEHGHERLAKASRDRLPAARRGCRPYGGDPPVRTSVDDLSTAFRCALRCAAREQLVAIADSLVHLRLATVAELRAWADGAPLERQHWLDLVDGRAESGTESMVRLRLRSLGILLRVQVPLWRGRRVDLLVGDRLIIECDSSAFHTDLVAYQRDRRYDRRHLAEGFLVLRLTWEQIHDEWPAIERDILAIVRRGDHRWSRAPREGSAR